MSKKDKKGFNNPFAAVEQKLQQLVPPPPAPTSNKVKNAPVVERKAPPPVDDERLFADEMLGVARIDLDPRGRIGAPPPVPGPPPSRRAADEAEAYAQLADLIEGNGPFDLADTDEFIEGLAPGLDKRLLRQLRKGDYALQGHLDLHGMTAPEARGAVESFITNARASGKRCVLLIHGRGLNSKDQIPVLKERVKVWLERGKVSRAVLAFCSARPCDGGAGAVYVLLRR